MRSLFNEVLQWKNLTFLKLLSEFVDREIGCSWLLQNDNQENSDWVFEDRLDIPNWLQCLWNFSILILVDGANLRAVIAGEQFDWFHSTDSCLASLQRALWKHISRICLFVPPECPLEVWRVTYGKKSNKSESMRKRKESWPRKLGDWPRLRILGQLTSLLINCYGASAMGGEIICAETTANFKISREWQTPSDPRC